MDLRINDLCFSYSGNRVLTDINVTLQAGCVTAIAGPNGVGKSTLLKCIARLLKAEKGRILYGSSNLLEMKKRELAKLQAYVPQSSQTLFSLTVEEYVVLGRKPYVEWSLNKQDYEIIDFNISYMGIEAYRSKYMDELSGGERQKVTLARALVQEPEILLLDEPTSALDIRHQMEVLTLLQKIAKERDTVTIIVLHDLTLIERFADRVILMKDGGVLACGEMKEVMTETNIRSAYDIEVRVIDTEYGAVVIPMKI